MGRLAAAGVDVVEHRGRPVRKIAGAFRTARNAAGFGFDLTEHLARGVPKLENCRHPRALRPEHPHNREIFVCSAGTLRLRPQGAG